MKLISLTCDKCNATLQVNSELKRCICQYCGNEMLIDDETIQVHHQMDNAYQTGYQMEMGRQQAAVDMQNRALYATATADGYGTGSKTKKEKTYNTWLCRSWWYYYTIYVSTCDSGRSSTCRCFYIQ